MCGEGIEDTHTLLNKLIDCSSWCEGEVALTQAEVDWLMILQRELNDQ